MVYFWAFTCSIIYGVLLYESTLKYDFNCRGPRQRPGEDLPNDCKIYVGNISPIIDDNSLREIFAPFGNVLHAAAVIDPMTKQTRGFGFVHMDNPTSAATAVRGMHGQVNPFHAVLTSLLKNELPTCHARWSALLL